MIRTIVAAALLLVVGPAAPAQAHTRLKEAAPAIGATVPPPTQIVLTYADPVIVPRVIVTDSSGGRHEAGTAHSVDNKVTQPVKGTLGPGTYTVGWRVVASDGHPVTGTYKFTVQGKAGPGQSAPAAGSSDSGGGSSGWWLIGLVALLAAGGAVLFRVVRR